MNVVVYLSRTTSNYGDEWLGLLEMNLDEMNVVVYLSRTTGNYGDKWLERFISKSSSHSSP
jgi:hypothetical protein